MNHTFVVFFEGLLFHVSFPFFFLSSKLEFVVSIIKTKREDNPVIIIVGEHRTAQPLLKTT